MWTVFQLALRSEYQDIIRREIHDLTGRDSSSPIPISELDMRTLRKASRTDSFIREVLRMKGDAVNLVRMARKDVQMGDYIVPKGTLIPQTTHFQATNLGIRIPSVATGILIESLPVLQ